MGKGERFESYFYQWFEQHPEVKVLDENDNEVKIMPRYGLLRHNNKKVELFSEPESRFLSDK